MWRRAVRSDSVRILIEFVQHEPAGLTLILSEIVPQVAGLGAAGLEHSTEQHAQTICGTGAGGEDSDDLHVGSHDIIIFR
jgi:hypothetical protein